MSGFTRWCGCQHYWWVVPTVSHMSSLPLSLFSSATQNVTISLIPNLLSRWPCILLSWKGNKKMFKRKSSWLSSQDCCSFIYEHIFTPTLLSLLHLGHSWTLNATPSPKSESSWLFLWRSCPHGLFTLTSRALQSCLSLYRTPPSGSLEFPVLVFSCNCHVSGLPWCDFLCFPASIWSTADRASGFLWTLNSLYPPPPPLPLLQPNCLLHAGVLFAQVCGCRASS